VAHGEGVHVSTKPVRLGQVLSDPWFCEKVPVHVGFSMRPRFEKIVDGFADRRATDRKRGKTKAVLRWQLAASGNSQPAIAGGDLCFEHR